MESQRPTDTTPTPNPRRPSADRKARTRSVATTPTVAIARVLRDLGLRQGRGATGDFSVTGEYVRGERQYTYVNLWMHDVNAFVAAHADEIERRCAETPFPFVVSVRYLSNGRPDAFINNAGKRIRETPPGTEEPLSATPGCGEEAAPEPAGTTAGTWPRHAADDDTRAALTVLDSFPLAPLTDDSDITDEVDASVRGVVVEPRGAGEVAVYWIEAGSYVGARREPHHAELRALADRLREAGWRVDRFVSGCLFAVRPDAPTDAGPPAPARAGMPPTAEGNAAGTGCLHHQYARPDVTGDPIRACAGKHAHQEAGVHNDEGCLEAYDCAVQAANEAARLNAEEGDPGRDEPYGWSLMCPRHREQRIDTCEECGARMPQHSARATGRPEPARATQQLALVPEAARSPEPAGAETPGALPGHLSVGLSHAVSGEVWGVWCTRCTGQKRLVSDGHGDRGEAQAAAWLHHDEAHRPVDDILTEDEADASRLLAFSRRQWDVLTSAHPYSIRELREDLKGFYTRDDVDKIVPVAAERVIDLYVRGLLVAHEQGNGARWFLLSREGRRVYDLWTRALREGLVEYAPRDADRAPAHRRARYRRLSDAAASEAAEN